MVRLAVMVASVVVLTFPIPVSGQSGSPDPDVVRQRAEAYLRDYEARLASVVAQERYDQVVQFGAAAPGSLRAGLAAGSWTRRRRLVSDYLLVRVPGRSGWQPFRDVREVDGHPVGDRDTRLLDLFTHPASQALDQAARIARESARFNIGSITRTINVPTLALTVLRESFRFDFRLAGTRRLEGIRTVGLAFRERLHPTFIRTSGDNDLEAEGFLWIDPDTGLVVQTELRTDQGDVRSQIIVTYRPDERLGLWVPARMREVYTTPTERVEGTAVYANYRQFTVHTFEVIKDARRRDTRLPSGAIPPRGRSAARSRGATEPG